MRAFVVVTTVLLLSAPLAIAASTPKLPAPVKPGGVAGAVLWMSLSDVRERWGIRMPAIEESGSSTQYTYGVICAGPRVGAAYFVNDQLRAYLLPRCKDRQERRGWIQLA